MHHKELGKYLINRNVIITGLLQHRQVHQK